MQAGSYGGKWSNWINWIHFNAFTWFVSTDRGLIDVHINSVSVFIEYVILKNKCIHVLQVRLEPIIKILLTLMNQNDLETQG